ncbi:MAG: S41 family peptidase [Minisyncoccia bacterium]
MNKEFILKYKISLIIALFSFIFFIGGYFVGFGNSINSFRSVTLIDTTSSDIKVEDVNMDEFWQVWKLLDSKFVSKKGKVVTTDEKIWGAISGLTNAYGDPYTVFMPPQESKIFNSDISGNFEGVGMEIGIKNSLLTVVAPLKGTPAFNAGIKTGDVIVSINGSSTDVMSVDEAVRLIRGKAGTEVNFKIFREGIKDYLNIKVARGIINIPTIDTEMKGDVFIIRLYNFYANSPDLFRGALREFVSSGKAKLIIDLRGNPGGYLDAAVDMASYFLPLGKTIVTEDFAGKADNIVYRSKGYGLFNENLKLVILIDGGSASASEILAGALQDNSLSKLVGMKSFGKGSVQELLNITGNTSLKVTVAKWLTPSGRSISDEGLIPDYEIDNTKNNPKNLDLQELKALEILK